MTTFTALTTVDGKEAAYALSAAMERMDPEPLGVGVFELEDGSGLWEIGGYFTEKPDLAALMLLSVAFGAGEFAISEVPETDWVAKVKRELQPVVADKVPEDCEPLLIEAAMAFGTGHHGTTLGCLRALDRLAGQGYVGQNVADIGCGTAVLAMAAARIWPNPVIASDIDEVAVDVARANAAANDLTDRVICVEAAGFNHPNLHDAAPFDLIFANILKGPLIELAPDVAAHAASGGYVILSGLLVEQAEDVTAAYVANGLTLAHREDIGEWSPLTLQK
jgi:ribosomal protein L11 methyltransferase